MKFKFKFKSSLSIALYCPIPPPSSCYHLLGAENSDLKNKKMGPDLYLIGKSHAHYRGPSNGLHKTKHIIFL